MRCVLFLAFAGCVLAQPTVAPSTEQVGKRTGDNVSGYNIVNSFETGYRFAEIGGNTGRYRSDINYTSGVRLLSSFFSVTSREGHGRFFDQIVLTTQGLGNDPYESATLRVEKNHLYRYDLSWRQSEYYNPGLTISYGEHQVNTLRRLQDHDLTLLPQSKIKFFLGYSRNTQNGPALTTVQLFDSRGDEFPLFANIHRQSNEYRVGNEIQAFGFRLNWMHGWNDFKEDTPVALSGSGVGNNTTDAVTLAALSRQPPYHGTSPYWRVALFRETKTWYALSGRFSYTAGRRAFVMDETALGTARFGSTNQQVLTYGNANRPTATGNFNLTLFPTSKLTVTNSTSVYNIRIDGNSYYTTVADGSTTGETLNFQYLGIRTIANQTQADYRFSNVVTVFAGYDYFNRRVRSVQAFNIPGIAGAGDSQDFTQTNQLHAGSAGVRLRPIKPLVIVLDGEVGRNDHPVLPTSDRNYQLLGAKVQYRLRNFTFSAQARSNYNTNSVSLTSFSSHSRNYSADMSWMPRSWVSLDASYARLHLDTLGGIAYFANNNFVTGESSYYVSNIHHGNLGLRFNLRNRADLFLGYSRVQDTGGDLRLNLTALSAFQSVQSFPLTFQSPIARFSLRLHERLRWNVGYQNYSYHEDQNTLQGYRANTGYTSLSWSF